MSGRQTVGAGSIDALVAAVRRWAGEEFDPSGQGRPSDDALIDAWGTFQRSSSGALSLDALAVEVADWSLATFPLVPERPGAGSVAHLRREVEELALNPSDPAEQADCFILLVGLARRTGVDLTGAVANKLAELRSRAWGEPDAEGVVEHVREAGEDAAETPALGVIRELLINRTCPCGGWDCARCILTLEDAQALVPDLRDNIGRERDAAEPSATERLGDLLAELDVPVRFGLRAQGHMPRIAAMLAEGKSWEDIGAAIGWDPATAERWYREEPAAVPPPPVPPARWAGKPTNEEPGIRMPAAGMRVETGPLQFGDDWPGVFIRGDQAASFAIALGVLLARPPAAGTFADSVRMAEIRGLHRTLASCILGPAGEAIRSEAAKLAPASSPIAAPGFLEGLEP